MSQKVNKEIILFVYGSRIIYPDKYIPFKVIRHNKEARIPAQIKEDKENNKLIASVFMNDVWINIGYVTSDEFSLEGYSEEKLLSEYPNYVSSNKLKDILANNNISFELTGIENRVPIPMGYASVLTGYIYE